MPSAANSSFDQVFTTTIKNRADQMADNITDNNSLLAYLKRGGNTRIVDGGETLVQPLHYAGDSTFKYYSGYDVLDVQATGNITAAEYDWKQAASTISMSGLEIRQNAGSKTRMFDLMATKIKNAEADAANNISDGVFSDGTGSGGLQIGGLQLLVADSPSTGTVGGINRATYSFWRNVSYDATTDGGAAATASNIQSYMNAVHVQLIRGTDKPNLIVADSNYFTLFEESLQTIQRITRTDVGNLGFTSLEYKGVPVLLDDSCPTNHMYFLNTDYLFYKVHRDANFTLSEEKMSNNQDAITKHLLWMGNMTMSNGSLQGVLKD